MDDLVVISCGDHVLPSVSGVVAPHLTVGVRVHHLPSVASILANNSDSSVASSHNELVPAAVDGANVPLELDAFAL